MSKARELAELGAEVTVESDGGLSIADKLLFEPNSPTVIGSQADVPNRINVGGVFENPSNRKGVALEGPILSHDAWVYDESGNNTGWVFDNLGGAGHQYQNASDVNDGYGTFSVSKSFYNGTSGSTYTVFDISTNHGWNGGTWIMELITKGYYASGYRRYVIKGGYAPVFEHAANYDHGTHFGSLIYYDAGQFADNTTNTPATNTDGSWHNNRIRVSGSSYGSLVVRLTVDIGTKVVNSINNPSQIKLY